MSANVITWKSQQRKSKWLVIAEYKGKEIASVCQDIVYLSLSRHVFFSDISASLFTGLSYLLQEGTGYSEYNVERLAELLNNSSDNQIKQLHLASESKQERVEIRKQWGYIELEHTIRFDRWNAEKHKVLSVTGNKVLKYKFNVPIICVFNSKKVLYNELSKGEII